MRLKRRTVLALLIFCLALSSPHLATAQSSSCRIPIFWSSAMQFSDADYVLHALATKAEVIQKNEQSRERLVRVTYELIESFKGSPERVGTLLTPLPEGRGCSGLPVLVGKQYVFMVMPFDEENLKPPEDKSIGFISLLGSQIVLQPGLNDPVLSATRALATEMP